MLRRGAGKRKGSGQEEARAGDLVEKIVANIEGLESAETRQILDVHDVVRCQGEQLQVLQ